MRPERKFHEELMNANFATQPFIKITVKTIEKIGKFQNLID